MQRKNSLPHASLAPPDASTFTPRPPAQPQQTTPPAGAASSTPMKPPLAVAATATAAAGSASPPPASLSPTAAARAALPTLQTTAAATNGSAASPPSAQAKLPASATAGRVQTGQRKLTIPSGSAEGSAQTSSSVATLPPSPSAAISVSGGHSRLSFPPSSPSGTQPAAASAAPSTPTPAATAAGLQVANVTAIQQVARAYAPSPLGSAFDEVRLPFAMQQQQADPPLMIASPSTGLGLLHPQAVSNRGHSPAHGAPIHSRPAYSNGPTPAHQIAQLPSSGHSSTPSPAVNLPLILIPSNSNAPSPVMWLKSDGSSQAHASPLLNLGSISFPAPATVNDAHAVVPLPSNSVPPAAAAAATPVTGSSMDSRQWAALLFKYRSGEPPGPSSRAVTANATSTIPAPSTVIPSAVTPSDSAAAAASSSLPFHSPNVLTSAGGVVRPPSRARSRAGQRRPSIQDSQPSEDSEKQMMQNELNRLRAVIAMQTHAATAPPAPVTPAPVPSPMLTSVQSSPSYAAAVGTPTFNGPGLSWNTAFAALSNNFAASPSPSHLQLPAAPTAMDQSAFALPSPVVLDASTAPDHRSTFRSMSMLIRSGSAAQFTHGGGNASSASSAGAGTGAGHFPHPPVAAPSTMLRTRSAEEPLYHGGEGHQQLLPQTALASITARTFSSTLPGIEASVDEIEEDLSLHYSEPEGGAKVVARGSPGAAAAGKYAHEIEEELQHDGEGSPVSDADAAPASSSSSSSQQSRHLTSAPAGASSGGSAGAGASVSSVSTSSIPLFFPTGAIAATQRKTSRTCDAACAERQKKERAELAKMYADEAALEKQKFLHQTRSLEQRQKKALASKDARIAQLEKLQSKLLQPHSKLVRENDDLTALVQRLREQVISLGAVPVGVGSPRDAEAKQSSGDEPLTALLLPESSASSDPSDDADSPQQPEPFFSTSAPRQVASKSRRRSQSFGNGSTPTASARASARQSPLVTSQGNASDHSPPTNGSHASPRTVAATVAAAASAATTPSTPPLTVSAPSRPAPSAGVVRPRKNSLKTTTTAASLMAAAASAHAAAATAAGIEGGLLTTLAAPVTNRPQRQNSRGRAVAGSGPPTLNGDRS